MKKDNKALWVSIIVSVIASLVLLEKLDDMAKHRNQNLHKEDTINYYERIG